MVSSGVVVSVGSRVAAMRVRVRVRVRACVGVGVFDDGSRGRIRRLNVGDVNVVVDVVGVPFAVVVVLFFFVVFFVVFVVFVGFLRRCKIGRVVPLDLDARVVLVAAVLVARVVVDGDVFPKLDCDVSLALGVARGRRGDTRGGGGAGAGSARRRRRPRG